MPTRSKGVAPESWEEVAEEGDSPDGDPPEDMDSEEVAPRIKKKPVRPEETKSKKEHVNVVFIGHVGKFNWNFTF